MPHVGRTPPTASVTQSKHRRIGLLVAAGLLAGCASAPKLPLIADGDAVALVVARAPPGDGQVSISNPAFGTGISTGAKSGTVLGGLWGLACAAR